MYLRWVVAVFLMIGYLLDCVDVFDFCCILICLMDCDLCYMFPMPDCFACGLVVLSFYCVFEVECYELASVLRL